MTPAAVLRGGRRLHHRPAGELQRRRLLPQARARPATGSSYDPGCELYHHEARTVPGRRECESSAGEIERLLSDPAGARSSRPTRTCTPRRAAPTSCSEDQRLRAAVAAQVVGGRSTARDASWPHSHIQPAWRAGLPTTSWWSSTVRVTTEPAPTVAYRPISRPQMTVALAPIDAPRRTTRRHQLPVGVGRPGPQVVGEHDAGTDEHVVLQRDAGGQEGAVDELAAVADDDALADEHAAADVAAGPDRRRPADVGVVPDPGAGADAARRLDDGQLVDERLRSRRSSRARATAAGRSPPRPGARGSRAAGGCPTGAGRRCRARSWPAGAPGGAGAGRRWRWA